MESDQIAVIGGDMRQWYLAGLLAQRGYSVRSYALCKEAAIPGVQKASSVKELLNGADVVICPVPFLKQGRISGTDDVEWEIVRSNLKKGQILFAGCIPEARKKEAEARGISLVDVMQEKQMTVRNSVAAAEGMIAEAITRSPKNLRGSNCIVLGYGTCGRTLADYLCGVGCVVRIYEKDAEALSYAEKEALESIRPEKLKEKLMEADLILNTIPEPFLTEERLCSVQKEAWILDMASEPGGVDYEAAEKLGLQAVLLPGLPGRYAPLSSAEILADIILKIWKGMECA